MKKLIKRWSKRMKIKKKLIENIRIRQDRAEILKEKCFELSMQIGEMISEADLVNYLIDTEIDNLVIEQEKLTNRSKSNQ